MCGFCGKAKLDGRSTVEPALILAMNQFLRHRGPDDNGIWTDGEVGFGFNRLSIIDLSAAGHQPMVNDGTCIVFNGEIYNFKELRGRLEEEGVVFRSHSDTEVILKLYQESGDGFVQELEGMFALAIWDSARRRIVLARDRMGVKPLYYYCRQSTLVFGSEIKAILADPEVNAQVGARGMAQFMKYGHSLGHGTIFDSIHELSPGSMLVLDDSGSRISRWWVTPKPARSRDEGEATYAKKARKILRECIKSCLVSDVPVGVFLSGGLDSSAIVGIMARDLGQKCQTFSLGFDLGPAFNELSDARVVARHFDTVHHEVMASSDDVISTLENLAWNFDDPFADPAAVPVKILADLARRHVKVVLTGEGSDELFGGYRRVAAEQLAQRFDWLPEWTRAIFRKAGGLTAGRFVRLGRVLSLLGWSNPRRRLVEWSAIRSDEEVLALLIRRDSDAIVWPRTPVNDSYDPTMDSVENKLYSDLVQYLPDTFLEKTDRATMAAGLEARVPFLERKMVEFAATIPVHRKVNGRTTKQILRTAVSDLLPRDILIKRKQGFAVPIAPWFTLIGPYAADRLLSANSAITQFCRRAEVERVVSEYQAGREPDGERLWTLLSFELWFAAIGQRFLRTQ